MRSTFVTSVFFFAVTVTAGYFAGSRSWNGIIHLTDSDLFETSRVPAAVKKEIDFSRLDGAELITATQKRLVTAARTIAIADGEIGIELGHFVTRGEDGKRKLACDAFYNRVTLRFEAEGVASAGEKPVMEVDSPCRMNLEDINAIAPISIPVRKIVKERAADMDLEYEDDVKFKFKHMTSSWPLRWVLESVRLYNNADTAREVKISQRELREIRPKPFMVFWHEQTRMPSDTSAK